MKPNNDSGVWLCAPILAISFLAILAGCENTKPPTSQPVTEANAHATTDSQTNVIDFKRGTILVASDGAWTASDPIAFRELMKRIDADDTVGLREMSVAGKLHFSDKGQRYRLIDVYDVPMIGSDKKQYYRLQVRAIGGPQADKEMYVLSMYVRPESNPKSKE